MLTPDEYLGGKEKEIVSFWEDRLTGTLQVRPPLI